MIRKAAVSWSVWAFVYRVRHGKLAPIDLIPDFVLRIHLTPHSKEEPAGKFYVFIVFANRHLGNLTLRQYWDLYRSMYCLLGWMTQDEIDHATSIMNKYYL